MGKQTTYIILGILFIISIISLILASLAFSKKGNGQEFFKDDPPKARIPNIFDGRKPIVYIGLQTGSGEATLETTGLVIVSLDGTPSLPWPPQLIHPL